MAKTAKTPEGTVKLAIQAVLDAHNAWVFMPVQSGFGRTTVDYIGMRAPDGKGFAIEAKRPLKRPTEQQVKELKAVRVAGGAVFVVDGTGVDLALLERWLAAHNKSYLEQHRLAAVINDRADHWLRDPKLLESS